MSRTLDPGLSGKLKGLERRFAILSHFSGSNPWSISIELSGKRDISRFDPSRHRMHVGVRPYVRHPSLEDLVPLAIEEALAQVRWKIDGFEPERYGCPVALFEILESGRIFPHLGNSPDSHHSDRLALFLELKCRRSLELLSWRRGSHFGLDPFFLGQCVLFGRLGVDFIPVDRSHPIRCFFLKPLAGFWKPSAYRAFLATWDATLSETSLMSWEDSARKGAQFYEEWRSVFDRSPLLQQPRDQGGFSISGASSASGSSGSNDVPPDWKGSPPPAFSKIFRTEDRDESGSSGKREPTNEEFGGLGLESESGDWTRSAEIPFYEPSPEAGTVFPWDDQLIQREVDGLLRFLKIGIREDYEDGLTGRLVPRKLSEPTFRVMRRPLDPRRPRDLRLLVIIDCSLSMTGAPHYYASHLTRVLEESGIAQTFDLVACSTRYLFRLESRNLNRLNPDETDGFYTLVPFLETIAGQYDLALVLSDCQNSERSIEALQLLGKKIPTIGCYVLPSVVADAANIPFWKIVEDGRMVFPRSFIHAQTFHGLGRRVALYLNGLRK